MVPLSFLPLFSLSLDHRRQEKGKGKKIKQNAPVIKDLAAHDVAADAPAVLVALLAQPVVAEHLGVKVVRLKRRVVDVHLGALKEEEAVVVDQLVAAVQPEEDRLVDALLVVYELHGPVRTGHPPFVVAVVHRV